MSANFPSLQQQGEQTERADSTQGRSASSTDGPVLPDLIDSMPVWLVVTQSGLDASQDPMQVEHPQEAPLLHIDEPAVPEAAPVVAHRNPFGPFHIAAEASHVEHDLELAGSQHIVDSDPELEETPPEVIPHAIAVITIAQAMASRVQDMASIAGGFTDPLPTDMAPLPAAFDAQG